MKIFFINESILCRVLFFFILMGSVPGQSSLSAQVLVHQEPKHRLVFENSHIRILDVVMAPGDSSVYHTHHTPSLFIFLSSTRTGSMLMGEQPSTGMNAAGNILYENLSAPYTRTHRVWNLDTDSFHVLDIELISRDSGFVHQPLQMEGLTLVIDTAHVRAYRMVLESNSTFSQKSFSLAASQRDFLVIAFEKVSVQTRTNGKAKNFSFARGGFISLPAGQSFSISQESGRAVQLALIEIPHK